MPGLVSANVLVTELSELISELKSRWEFGYVFTAPLPLSLFIVAVTYQSLYEQAFRVWVTLYPLAFHMLLETK